MTEFLQQHPDRLDYDYLNPDGAYDYQIQPGDTAWSIGDRFQAMTGADNVIDALDIIVSHNNMQIDSNGHVLIIAGQELDIPVIDGFELTQYHDPFDSITTSELSDHFNSLGVLMADFSPEDIAQMNGVGVDELVDSAYVPIIDDYAHIQPMQAPLASDDLRAQLVVLEDGTGHHEDAYEVAASVFHAIDPASDMGSVHAFNTYEIGNVTQGMNEIIIQSGADNTPLVFNVSLSNNPDDMDLEGLDRDSYFSNGNSQYLQEYAEWAYDEAGAVFFVAAGNSFDDAGFVNVAFDLASGQSGVLIAATDQLPNGDVYITAYSSPGADFAGPPLVNRDGEDMHGTSFSSPHTAAIYTKMVEWYGERLEHNEIMAAASMSTDIDIYEHLPGESALRRVTFHVNDGGRPFHDRAGAGVINPEQWAENLERMATLKSTMEHEPEYIEDTILLDTMTPESLQIENSPYAYVYEIHIPQDMTLDRLTLALPQANGARGDTGIMSPSGFVQALPVSSDEIQSTSAFMLEDVQAGDILQIYTNSPFTEGAQINLRGYEDGNAVQMLRDYLQEEQLIAQPNSVIYDGRTIIADEPAPTQPQQEQIQPLTPLPTLGQ
jgi:hypothetical protein